MNVSNLRNRPIPNLDGERATRGYREVPIDRTHPLYDEPCLDALAHGLSGNNYYYGRSAEAPNNPPYYERLPHSMPQIFLRKSVVEKLRRMNECLKAERIELYLLDGFRPAELQHHLHSRAPEIFAASVARHADIDADGPSPHATGSAVDLRPKYIGGEFVPMGTEFDDPTRDAYPDAFEGERGECRPIIRANRRLLYWLAEEVGLVTNPREWWHLSVGDQLAAQIRAFRSGEAVSAYYSVVDPRST